MVPKAGILKSWPGRSSLLGGHNISASVRVACNDSYAAGFDTRTTEPYHADRFRHQEPPDGCKAPWARREEVTMRLSIVWVIEFIKLLARRRLHPLNAECPICHKMVRLHCDSAGRRHLLAHARALYEGSRYSVHYTANAKCLGSDTLAKFDPRPNENQHFKWPKSLDCDSP